MMNILTIEDQEYSTLEAPYQDVINLVVPAYFLVSFSGRNPDGFGFSSQWSCTEWGH